ncbi:hypothetical protein CRENBAI_020993 [Crenichthys baileyi]|uniref:Uncharacterized protein n=1 Tax=Crenichthys baileyi TaxID=28760 RepID=A0AAV9R4H8_9TELE
MAPIMEGTHTILLLYEPIHELSNISLYFPKRRPPIFKYKSRTSHSASAGNDLNWGKQNLAVSKQRGQYLDSSGKLFNSQQATKEAVEELCLLAAEHHQLLAGLLSLCRDCANKVRMGNQDGKFQEWEEGQEVYLGRRVVCDSNCSISGHKMGEAKSKKVKRLGGKKPESSEDLLHTKMKKKATKGQSHVELPTENKVSTSAPLQAEQVPKKEAYVSDSTLSSSNVRNVSKPVPTIEEPLQTIQENWDFIEDNQTFDHVVDFCNDFSECDGELGYASSSCSLIEGLNRQQSGGNLRPIKRFDSAVETLAGNGSTVHKSAQHQLYSGINQRNVRVVAKLQDVEGKVFHVSRANPNEALRHPGTSKSKQDTGEWGMQNGDYRFVSKDNGNKRSEGLRLPLSNTAEPSAPVRSHSKSPCSSSLAGVFNTSFPASNSLQSMSPVLSPLSTKQLSPQLNHRIVLLSDKDEDPYLDSSSNTDEPKSFNEIIDRNGNKRTVTRMDLELNKQPNDFKRNSSSNSTTTGRAEISGSVLDQRVSVDTKCDLTRLHVSTDITHAFPK